MNHAMSGAFLWQTERSAHAHTMALAIVSRPTSGELLWSQLWLAGAAVKEGLSRTTGA